MKTLVRVIMQACLTSAAVVGFGPFAYAQKVCPAAISAIERAMCEQPALRILQGALERRADRWQKYCGADASSMPSSPRSHALWLADVLTKFERSDGVEPQDYLGASFTQRADELAEALLSCEQKSRSDVRLLKISTIHLPVTSGQDDADTLPFVQTKPAFVGLRINDALYRELLGIEAPVSPRMADVRKALLQNSELSSEQTSGSSSDAPSITETINASVLWRNPRMLVFEVITSGCETRCWKNSELRLFDLRTGSRFELVDLLSTEGRLALARLRESSVLQVARALRQRDKKQWEPAGIETFDRCINEWRKWSSKDISQISWLSDKRWLLTGPECAGDGDAMPSPLQSKVFALSALAPYLNAFGKNLLFGQGDVRTPELQVASCSASDGPPDPQGWAKRVVEISAGENHVFLREASGRVWGFGRNYNGAVGNGSAGGGGGSWVMPFVMGEDYLYAGAGQGFSAVVRRDGSLSTWGSGYAGRLGDGAGDRAWPVSIGQGFAFADVDNYGGRALARDGSLWAWGGSQQPKIHVVARDVTQVRGSIPVLMLRRDGGLWAWNEWHWIRPGQTASTPDALSWHGTGFERLPQSHQMELAWRSDGTVWAWGRTLGAMATSEALPGLGQSPWPRLVGKDWEDVKASEDSTLIAARKADGSLWVSQESGSRVRMKPLGCGFADFAFAYDEEHGIHLLALRTDGTLFDYHSSKRDGANVRRDLLEHKPEVLMDGGIKLFQENDYWGNVGAAVFLLRNDGSLFQWYWHFGTQYPSTGVPTDQRLRRIDFPMAWFQGGH